MTSCKVLGKAWLYDDGEKPDICFWVHELDPMDTNRRSSEDWAYVHFRDIQDEKSLRDMFRLPPDGNFQVLFSGTLCGQFDHTEEWDEEFTVDEFQVAEIPDDYGP